LYLTNLTDKNIKVCKTDNKKLKLSGISSNSKSIKKGMLFAVIKGDKKNINKYVLDAFKLGARAVLCRKKDVNSLNKNIKNILVSEDIRLAVAKVASEFFPYQPKNISAITGTNGKTSIANFLYEIWKKNKINAACFGTLGIKYKNVNKKTRLTTLDPINLHRELNNLNNKKINFLVMEASSHALDQRRLDKVKIKFAVFTNLSRDHLDYHKNMKKYFISKTRLFKNLLDKKGIAVINFDNPYGEKIKIICDENNIANFTYGFKEECDWRILEINRLQKFTEVTVKNKNKNYRFRCKLIADYEIENLLAAIILANKNGLLINNILKKIGNIKQSEGRLKKIFFKNNIVSIYIDYAHTPEALKKSLKALRLLLKPSARLLLVFGCGGDRDKGKRKMMGKIAERFADKVFITDDNPRYENANHIREEISSYCKKSENIAGRKKAIDKAISKMKKDDILLIAGKGHEKGQEIKGNVFIFDDEFVAKQIFNKRFTV
tara:strand:- start:5892 stop:7367 length:1476 start_codon:yes stop_codon:yes gene_type:complete